jgi:tetratricopeptide (TPR) repeat protein
MADVTAPKVTIFVSSPTDVMPERERAARVVDRLQSRFREHVTFVPIFFEEKEKYYTAEKSFQEQIPDAGAADLVISIFWSKLGSELAPDLFGTMPNGNPYPGGAVYELMRALAAKRQRHLPDILVYRKIADTGISVTDPEQRRLMNAQLDAFEMFWKQWFVSEQGHFRAGFQTFMRPDEFEHLLEGHVRAWLDERGLLGKEVIWRIAERGSPFRGLEPYEPRHADVFFGRAREIDRARDRLLAAAAGGTAFLLVMGASGSGKSSLVRAGLVTRLTEPGDIDGVDAVRFAVMRPGGAATPQRALAEALFRSEALPELVDGDSPTPELLATTLGADASAATLPILGALKRSADGAKAEKGHDHSAKARLLVVVDQLEELFATTVTEAERTRFIRLMAVLARSGRILVIATLRSSAYGALARESELVALKDAGATLDVAVPGSAALAEIVRRPAAAAGLVFDRRGDQNLDDELLKAAGGNADALPLLGFTLQWLFENRDGTQLTVAAYDQLGGLDGAIGRAAEEAFANLDQAAQAALPRLLRGLGEASRRTDGLALRDMPLADAPEGTPLRTLADALVAARVLLVHGEGQGAMLRLAHEAVLRGWVRARDIITKERDFFRIREDVTAAEQRWRGKQSGDLLLARGLPLAEAQSLKTTYGAELAPDLIAFIDASVRQERRRQRRGYALAAVFALVAIVAIATGAIAWRQQQIAEQHRRIAQEQTTIAEVQTGLAEAEAARAGRNFIAAKSAIDAVIYDVAEGLKDIEGMRAETVHRILGQAEAAVGQLALSTEDAPAVRGSQGWMFLLFSETYLKLGSTELAGGYARKAIAIFRPLAANEPANGEWLRNVSLSLGRFGKVQEAQGNHPAALATYREGLDIARALAAKDPDNAKWQRDVSVCLNNVGDVLLTQDNRAAALAAFREGLDIRRALAATNPANTEWQRDVSVSLEKVADVLLVQGDRAGALTAYREDLAIARALAAKDPGNTKWQRDVSVSVERIGNVLLAEDDRPGALAAYREGLAIRRVLGAKDPGNTQWQRDITVSLEKAGNVLEQQGDRAGALAAYREGLDIRRALAAMDAGNAQWRRDVSVSLNNVGDVLHAQGDHPGALAAYREGLAVRRALAAKDPDNTQWRRDVSVSLERVGFVLEAQDDRAGALAAYREGLVIRRALVAIDPDNTLWQRDVSVNLNNVGDVLLEQGERADALATYREGLGIVRALVALDPGNTQWLRDISLSLRKVGDALDAQGDHAGALAAYREDLDNARALSAKDPTNTVWRRDVSVGLHRVGDVLATEGDRMGALTAYREGLAIRKALVAENSGNSQSRDDLHFSIGRIGGLSYRFVLAGNYAMALETSDEVIPLAPDEIWLCTNRAHALMFLGREDEARMLYLQYRGHKKVQGEKSWEAVILEDLEELRKAGLAHPLMDEIGKQFGAPR